MSVTDPGLEPLDGLRVALVGPGRVGTSLAHWARSAGASVELVAGRSGAAAEARTASVARDLGARAVTAETLSSKDCDLLLVAVADGALDAVARTLSGRPQAPVALHTAGSRGASALAPLADSSRTAGRPSPSAAGSFHPLKAFPAPLTDPAEAAGTFFALDGPPAALALGRRLAAAFGGSADVVPEALRPLYHLAASVAAGGVATLVTSAAELAQTLGLPDAVGRGYLTLATGALSRLAAAADAADRPLAGAFGAAITGPVARGDDETFVHQMEALRATPGTDGGRRALFLLLALETARLTGAPGEDGTRRRGTLEEALRAAGFDPAGADREPPGGQG